jgi:hypothetical protein
MALARGVQGPSGSRRRFTRACSASNATHRTRLVVRPLAEGLCQAVQLRPQGIVDRRFVCSKRLVARALLGYVLETNTFAGPKRSARGLDSPQELRVVLESVLKPVVLRPEPDEHTCGTPVAGDDDLLASSQPQVPGEIILDFRQSDLAGSVWLPARATSLPRASG